MNPNNPPSSNQNSQVPNTQFSYYFPNSYFPNPNSQVPNTKFSSPQNFNSNFQSPNSQFSFLNPFFRVLKILNINFHLFQIIKLPSIIKFPKFTIFYLWWHQYNRLKRWLSWGRRHARSYWSVKMGWRQGLNKCVAKCINWSHDRYW